MFDDFNSMPNGKKAKIVAMIMIILGIIGLVKSIFSLLYYWSNRRVDGALPFIFLWIIILILYVVLLISFTRKRKIPSNGIISYSKIFPEFILTPLFFVSCYLLTLYNSDVYYVDHLFYMVIIIISTVVAFIFYFVTKEYIFQLKKERTESYVNAV